MTGYRELLDPNHTLPEVCLIVDKSDDSGDLLYEEMSIIAEDEAIGTLNLVSEIHDTERIAHFDGIEINQSKRKKGLGIAAYLLAIELSHDRKFDFQTQNFELTEHSKKIWEQLAKKGIAEVVEPFVPSQRIENRFVGKYRVPRLNTN